MASNISQIVLTGQISSNQNKNESYEIAVLFDYLTDETSSVDADITDNWVESNYTLQDHIAIKPRTYRLRGCVGEVVFKNNSKFEDWANNLTNNHPVLQKTQSAVNTISSLSGVVSNYTRAAMNLAKQLESSVNRYKQIWQNYARPNQFLDQRQKAVYAGLTQLLQTRQPVKLTGLMYIGQDGWFIENAYNKLYFLQSVSAHQGESKYISDIEVTIKEFRIATTLTTKVDKSKFGGLAATQKTSEANNGAAKGIETQAKTDGLGGKSNAIKVYKTRINNENTINLYGNKIIKSE